MAAKGQSLVIDKLWAGISGQAPWLRKIGTVSAAQNIRFDVRLGGAMKRNGTTLIGPLEEHTSTQSLDPSGRYLWCSIRGAIIAIGRGDQSGEGVVFGWDADGNPLEVIDNSGGAFDDYLSNVIDPIADLDVTTSYDTMVVANRKRRPTMQNGWTRDESYSYLLNGDPDGTANTNQLPAVDFFSDLSGAAVNGDVTRVKFDENLDPAGLYLYFEDDPHADYEDGYFPQHDNWFRIPSATDAGARQKKARYNVATMPHRIVYSEDAGTLILDVINWRQRVTGNVSTIKEMPWADGNHHIRSVEFFAGRLFLISEEHVTASRNNDFWNLWVENGNAIADDDRISTNVTQADHGEVMRSAVCGQAIFLLAENGQLEFGSGDLALTNINGRIRTLTDFPARDIAPGFGPGIVTMVDRFNDIHQFMWGGTGDPSIIYTDMLTAHYPKAFNDQTVKRLLQIGTTLFAITDEDHAKTHDTFVIQSQAVQSAWGTFAMADYPVLFDQWNGKIRIITADQDSDSGFSMLHYVHRLVPPPAGMLYEPCLDRLELISPSAMSYDEDTDETTMPHTGRDGSVSSSYVVTRTDGDAHVFLKAKRLDDNGNPVFDGDLTGGSEPTAQYLGFVYQSSIELSKLYAELSGRGMQMQRMVIFHYETTDYSVTWSPFTGASEKTDAFQAHKVGVATIGQASFETGYHEVGIVADPRDGTLTIASSTPGIFGILALEYELQPQGRG